MDPKNGLLALVALLSDYEVSGTYYRAHVFTGSGTFDVSDTGTTSYPSNVEYLVVAGGGGGGARGYIGNWWHGGAGGLRTNLSGHGIKWSALCSRVLGTYTVTVGGGNVG